MKLDKSTRNKLNARLAALATHFPSPGLALAAALGVLETEQLWFDAIFAPKTGTVRVTVLTGPPESPSEVRNSLLIMQLHEMESGRVELVSYLS
ncbi:MAG: hypothetical protein AB7L09_01860 [Nitrospira sp.]